MKYENFIVQACMLDFLLFFGYFEESYKKNSYKKSVLVYCDGTPCATLVRFKPEPLDEDTE